MPSDTPPHPEPQALKWPQRVIALYHAWKSATTERDRNRALSELWLLLNAVLAYYVRSHGPAHGFVDVEDARDIASEKAMVFLRGFDAEASGSSPDPARVCAYLSTLARNGLVDTLRHRGRSRDLERKLGEELQRARPPAAHNVESHVQHTQFVEALRECIDAMTPRARLVWFLRAFLDLPSKKIASHPEVEMTRTAVDMVLSRTRQALRKCMAAKGFDAKDAPAGTFVELWDLWKRGLSTERRSSDDTP